MNQRASHFTLGTNATTYNSIYKKDYLGKQGQKNQVQPLNPFRGSSLQNQNQKSSFQTTNKTLLKDWGKVETAKLDDKKLQNLRGHHFNLGNYNPGGMNTSHKIFYDRKHISNDANKNQQQSKIKMRAHHHDFKEQNYTNFQSSYLSQYTPFEAKYQKHNGANNEGGNSIVLGNHRIPMVTSNAIDFTQKHSQNTQVKNSMQHSSALVLGNEHLAAQPMETMNQLYYNKKDITKNQLPQATMKELRSTHFNLGTMKQSYATQSKHYQPFVGNQKNKFEIPKYQCGTWVDKNANFQHLTTTNQRELPQRQVEPFKKQGSSIRSGFELGATKNTYETQFHKNFTQKPNTIQNRAPNGKRPDNVVIGMDKCNYISEQKSNYQPRDLKLAKSNAQSIKAMNTEDHFKIGGSGQNCITTYQDQYRKDIQNKNVMFHSKKM